MLPIPTKFFVTSGKAVSKVSDLNAFDEALQNAGLAEQAQSARKHRDVFRRYFLCALRGEMKPEFAGR